MTTPPNRQDTDSELKAESRRRSLVEALAMRGLSDIDVEFPRPICRIKNPPHPGSFVRAEIIEPAHLSVTAAADVLGVTRPALSAFLNERSSLSPEMALRLEKAFGVSMDTLMRMQSGYDIAQARKLQDEITVEPYRPAA